MGFKSQPKLNRHSDERLVKISDQNTQGVRRSKSQTESEQTGFLKTKRPGFLILMWNFRKKLFHVRYRELKIETFIEQNLKTQWEIIKESTKKV